MRNHLITLVILFIFIQPAFSQEKEIITKDVVGDVNWEPTLSDAIKISDSPKSDTVTVASPAINYSINPVRYNTTFEPGPIKAVKIKDETITKLYKNYVKLGFGNYTTPYAELFLSNLRSKEYAVGAHLKHQSSSGQINDYGPSGFSDNLINLYGEKYLPNYAIGADVNYTRNVVHFYGFDPDKFSFTEKELKQRFNYFNTSLVFSSRYMEKFKMHHTIKLKYYNSADLFNSKENELFLEANASKTYNQYTISLLADETFINYTNDPLSVNRNIVNITPGIGLQDTSWSLRAGFKVSVESDSTSNTGHLYPDARLTYTIIDKVLVFNGVFTGGIQKNNFRTFSSENPFIDVIGIYKNTNNRIDFSGELKTAVSMKSDFTLGATYKDMSNAALFINTYSTQNKFTVVYDNIQMLNVHGSYQYQSSEKIRILLKADYFKYGTSNELKAWHKPGFQLSLSGHYNLNNKIIVKADVFFIGERFAKGYDAAKNVYAITLHAVADANLGMEYRFTKLLSFYININNLGGVRYYQWNNYPSQRVNVMAGITYSF
jgi:hypothetical protein